MKKESFVVISFLMFFLNLSAQTGEVMIKGSQTQIIHSSVMEGQDYELQIMLPTGYSNSNKIYPAVYVMDSQWDFPLVTALYGQQYYDGFIPELIIVGVTWTGRFSNPDSLRARDYTPTNEKRMIQSGGADQFLSFMKKELFPFVESHYRTDKNNRTLMGCSLGGLFTLYTLFTQPDLFRGYVAASPAIGWDKEVIYGFEKKYFEKKSPLLCRLYLTEGEVERGVENFNRFVSILNQHRDSSLQIKSRVLENTGHSGTKAETFARGLQFVFERPSLKLSKEKLKKFSGAYTDTNGNTIQISESKNGLVLSFSETNKYNLNVASQSELYSASEFLNLYFKKDKDGNVSGLDLVRYGSSQTFSKTKP